MRLPWTRSKLETPRQSPIRTRVPGADDIELLHYYDAFVRYYENCEPETKRWFVDHAAPDWVVLDCGANIGYYSILFARLSPQGCVYAFEPTSTAAMLRGNLEHNGVADRVEVIEKALGARIGLVEEGIYRIWGQPAERRSYEFITVDGFVAERCLRVDAIKIDVDSFDLEVLQGAERTLRAQDPYVMVELNHALSVRQQTIPQALRFMTALGYRECESYDHENYLFKRGPAKRSPGAEIVIRFPAGRDAVWAG